MLKVAIIGCGKIADSHAAQIRRIPGAEIVGVCDREELMAKQFYERFPVKKYFPDLTALLRESRPDVVHITTPPQSHFELATQCLKHGCHVYIEKPFTVNTAEAKKLIDLANEHGRKIAPGHDDQFRHGARRMRQLIQAGYLGGPPVHMESHYCYELGDGYARALLGDSRHWVRRLPGGLLQNIISHGIARIAEHLQGDNVTVLAHGFVSAQLERLGEADIVDELRVILQDAAKTTAYFTFSTQMRPSLHQFKIFGSRNGLLLDQDNESVIKLRGARHKSYLEQFVPHVSFARQYLANLRFNAKTFLARDFHPKSGMKYLIEAFYRSVLDGSPPPVPYREILLTSSIMDQIFEQLQTSRLKPDSRSGEHMVRTPQVA